MPFVHVLALSPIPRTIFSNYNEHLMEHGTHNTQQISIKYPQYGIKTHFMNVLLTVTNEESGAFIMQKYDKRRDLPFSYSQFIKFKSNKPVKQAYNVVISQTVPILYLSSTHDVALQEINALFTILFANGFRLAKLQQIVIKFLTSNHFLALRFDKDQLLQLIQGMQCFLLCIVFHKGRVHTVVYYILLYTTFTRMREKLNRASGMHTVSGCITSIHSYTLSCMTY